MLLLATKLKNNLNKAYTVNLKNIAINGNKRGCSGFVSHNDKVVYINTETLCNGYLYRIAQHTKDYTGGINRYAKTLEDLIKGVNALL